MIKKIIVFCSIFILISFNLFASTNLCTLTSDIDANKAVLTYDLDESSGRSISHLYQEIYENGKMTSRDEIKIENLNNGGIVLLQKDKMVVVRIWSDNFDRDLGGVINIDTLYNGINGERRQYEMDVVKDKNDKYVLLNNKNEFDKMKFIAKRSKLFGVVGIEKILFSK